jgi:predicted ATPase with chaperone activity
MAEKEPISNVLSCSEETALFFCPRGDSIRNADLLRGDSIPCPGEISLTHNASLFFDQLSEFYRTTLKSVRQRL